MVREEQKKMSSREKILERIKNNQPAKAPATQATLKHSVIINPLEKFQNVLQSIGGEAMVVDSKDEIQLYLSTNFPQAKNIISSLSSIPTTISSTSKPHDLSTIEVAILEAQFGVAENGAVWLPDKNMIDRVLPFICENLILVIRHESIVSTLHEAYDLIDDSLHEYGVFIAGPSKTADIEQSLVLGAHGAKTLTVFIVK
jgi:L-lactate dehydrogenase complex protein LldG